MNVGQLIAALAGATACALLADRLQVPGGLILGAMVGAAAVTLSTGTAVTLPSPLRTAAFVVIGAAIGVRMTRDVVASLGPVLLPAALSAVLIIAAGLAIAWLLRSVGIAPPADLLATSPGAFSVMTAMAVEQDTGAVEVALFHLVRIVMVILSLPLLVRLAGDL